jgi:hypothetical protein
MGLTSRPWRQVGARIGAGVIIGFGAYQALLGVFTFTDGPAVWAWVHLANGGLATATGLYLLTDAVWTQRTAMAAAALSGVANTFLMGQGVLWPMLVVALDVVVIVCLVTLPAAAPGTGPDHAEVGPPAPAEYRPGSAAGDLAPVAGGPAAPTAASAASIPPGSTASPPTPPMTTPAQPAPAAPTTIPAAPASAGPARSDDSPLWLEDGSLADLDRELHDVPGPAERAR